MADTSPVAHEGNPKEAEITIGVGEVLSTATLTVELPFIPIETPPTVIVPPPPLPDGCFCDLTHANLIVGCPTCGMDLISPADLDHELIIVDSAPTKYGFCGTRICCPPTQNGVPTGTGAGEYPCQIVEVYIRYHGLTEGAPRTGFAIHTTDSTKDDFTGYGVVIDEEAAKISQYAWVHQSLANVGTLVTTADWIPGNFGWFYFYSEFSSILGERQFLDFSPGDVDETYITTGTYVGVWDLNSSLVTAEDIGLAGVVFSTISVGNDSPGAITPQGSARYSALAAACDLCYTGGAITLVNIDGTCDKTWT